MDEEKTIETMHSLYQLLATFQKLKFSEMLLLGRQTAYEHTVEESYAALVY